jgi:P-type Ca2+ transporter type 2C
MRRPPRRKDEPIISTRLIYRVLFSASIIVFGTLFIYTYALSDDHMSRREQTMVRLFQTWPNPHLLDVANLACTRTQTFTCFVFLDLVSALQNRGLGCGITQNKMLLSTVSVSFVVQLMLVYVPFMQRIFQTAALDFDDLATLLGLGCVSAGLHEVRRRYERALNSELTFAHAAEELAWM